MTFNLNFNLKQISLLVTELFDLNLCHPGAYEGFSKHIRRLDLATLVVPAQWSKFPFTRTVLPLERLRLLEDAVLRQQVIEVVADNLFCLVRRDLKASHHVVLATLTAEHLNWCISTLWVNQLMAPAVVEHIMNKAIKEGSQTWLRVEQTIDSIGRHCQEK